MFAGLVFSMILGLLPAFIAQSKGSTAFFLWWFYGTMLFIVALPHSLLIKKDSEKIEKKQIIEDGLKKCPMCAELVKNEAVKCKHCGSELKLEEVAPAIVEEPVDMSNGDITKCVGCGKSLAKGEVTKCYPCSK